MNALTLPDIARQTTTADLPLDWVGMQGIALPVQIGGQRVAAEADAGVSLDDPQARGIHMSRLYLALAELEQGELDLSRLRAVLQRFLDSHAGLSRRAYLRLRLAPLLRRPALVSPLSGWKRYPLVLDTRLEGDDFQAEVHLELTYSSTCPCSAALARQLIQERFDQDFAGQPLDHASVLAWLGSSAGIVATPHSQRSSAHLRIGLAEDCVGLPLEELADLGESARGTAVQTAVKRADEQAFALANGQNLMFCEDAVRRLHRALQGYPQASRFSIRVVHAESLHAHDAVAESHWQRGAA
ncbi:GTP cyclohydrolase I FolE2 [Pseudomonas aeruginosa]|nr:GTP cyclohydrolase I FolE2 [Pseudomonas aeruginosa]